MLKSRNLEFTRTLNTFQGSRMHFLPTTFLEIAVYLFTIGFPSCLLPLFQNEFPCKNLPMKMKLDLHEYKLAGETHCHGHKNGFVRKLVFTLRQGGFGNGLFCHENGKKMSSFVKKSLNLVTPACDHAVAIATLKSWTHS